MHLIARLLLMIETVLTLPDALLNVFEKNQKKLPLTSFQKERLILFLPLLNFPAIALEMPLVSILLLFFLFLMAPRKASQALFIELSFLLSLGCLFPHFAPFVFLWAVASWILSLCSPPLSFSHSMHRFLWMTTVLIYPPFLFILAPLLFFCSVCIGIQSQFFAWESHLE